MRIILHFVMKGFTVNKEILKGLGDLYEMLGWLRIATWGYDDAQGLLIR